MTSSAALTAAKAAAAATSADLEAIAHRLEAATTAHAETSAELAAVLAADAAGESEAVAHDVAVLRAELELRTSRLAALKNSHAKAAEANRRAGFRLRAETLKASKCVLSTDAVDALVAAATEDVAVILRKLAATLTEGNVANAAAYELNKVGAIGNGLQISGYSQKQTVSINGSALVDYINVNSQLESVGKKAADIVEEELRAPAQAARAAKFAADAERDAKHAAERRAYLERNEQRVDVTAL